MARVIGFAATGLALPRDPSFNTRPLGAIYTGSQEQSRLNLKPTGLALPRAPSFDTRSLLALAETRGQAMGLALLE